MNTTDNLWHPQPVCADARLRRWLLDRGSLTRRIQLRCENFRLDVLSQRLAAARRDERAVIGVRADADCMVREISLNCGRQPLVFAHSVVAPRALKGAWRMLSGLGARPLGAALFADPRIRRFPLRFRQLNRGHALYQRAQSLVDEPSASLWARRSLFVFSGSPLLVTEVFLPAILALAP
ncbi:MAG: chorismate lyase [Betaproteobacteria bacterium]|nr:chorismate lyase [Betaproteobacteria bacterium]